MKTKKKWRGKSVCVVQGEEHTRSYHIFKKDNPTIQSSRTFLNEGRFSFDLEFEVEKRLSVGSHEDRELALKRLFITRLVLGTVIRGVTTETIEKKDKLARSLESDEVDKIFERLAEIQKYVHEEEHDTPNLVKVYVFKQVQILGQQIIEKHPLFAESSTQVV
ncbi:MAG: hypothetical protein HYV90_04695 [Candidatus Woesebacteria bacterium]|nr:MAG: hypothetical protein HYV90_04695 [Candidatus Woesebacteria bacterium]